MRNKEAEQKYQQLQDNGFRYSGSDIELRNKLFHALDHIVPRPDANTNVNWQTKDKYSVDLDVGLCLYELLPPQDIGLRTAADDGTWKHLSLLIIPDLVYRRWGDAPNRFYSESKRIWLKTLWWYVHLSWQNDEKTTRTCLAGDGLSTDAIVQLVERSGSGYRVDLYREIMKQFPIYKSKTKKKELFRAVMKLNTAMLLSMEPTYAKGGTEGYVEMLYMSKELALGVEGTSQENALAAGHSESTLAAVAESSAELGAEKNIDDEYSADELLAAVGDANAQFRIGERMFTAGDFENAFDMFVAATKQKHPKATHWLGLMYEQGLGTVRNPAQAAKLYQRAYESGYPRNG